MNGEISVSLIQAICDHAKHRTYTLRRFDILKGFELNETRCFNCHKMVAIDIKKFGATVENLRRGKNNYDL
jgi:hypothetical protein